MIVVQAVRTRLLAIAAVTTLVGQRVSALTLPQKPTLPAIRLQQIGSDEAAHLRGTDGLRRARIQLDAIAQEGSGDAYSTAHAVSDAAHGTFVAGVATGLAGWRGTIGGLTIQAILPLETRESYDPDELRQVLVSQDYFVWYVAA